ncbi:hypothetical protein WN944_024233 [Citrus x changshan-huyou]|uniref:Uncharacterized protein n=1 Tax=Citrus x changshan-huyou TaxID=2935761 RepID=A0AAP0LNA1_9ROSI
MALFTEQFVNEGYEPLNNEQLSQAVCGKKSGYISGLGVYKPPRHLQASTSNENDSALRNELKSTKTELQATKNELQETKSELQSTKTTIDDLLVGLANLRPS